MTDITDKKSKLDAVMARLRVTYIDELPERISSLEELVLNLEHSNDFVDNYQKLFRDVHSLKGSGGTFGFPIITTICHQMEDLLKEVGEKTTHLSQNNIDALLKYIDLFHQVPVRYQSGDTSLLEVEASLNKLQDSTFAGRRRCLLVEGSVTTQKMVSLVLENEQADISLADDGVEALQRLLHEDFDLLITGMVTGDLNGMALIAATRLSDSANSNIPAILLTTSETNTDAASLSANIIIRKGPDMPTSLLEAYRHLL